MCVCVCVCVCVRVTRYAILVNSVRVLCVFRIRDFAEFQVCLIRAGPGLVDRDVAKQLANIDA